MNYKQSLPQRIMKSTVVIALSIFLSGCFANDVDKVFADYQKRMQRLLDEPAVEPEMPIIPRQPGVSDVRQNIPEGNISLLESMRLNQCRAGQLIAQRNSSLGRVQSVQARVLYEIEMIPALTECLQNPDIAESSLGEALALNLQEKISNLPLWIDRFWSSEPAIRDTFRPGRSVRDINANSNIQESLAALNYFASFFAEIADNPHTISLDRNEWQRHMEALGNGRAIPELLRTQQHVAGWLVAVTEQLATGAQALGCKDDNSNRLAPPQNAEYMQNVLNAVWIQKLQPALARWDNEYRQVNETLQRITPQVQSAEWHAYLIELFGNDSYIAQTRQLAREHAEEWQAFLSACELNVR